MAQENTKLCDFSNTNNYDFITTPIAPATSAESYEINVALLNLVMEDQFSRLPIDSLNVCFGDQVAGSVTLGIYA